MEPTMIFVAGNSCTGKSTLARGICRAIPSSLLIEKDEINEAISHVRPTRNGRLPSVKEYLKSHQATYGTDLFGGIVRLPCSDEFYARHVRDQTYQAMIQLAARNLELGKSPIFESLFPRQFEQEGFIDGVLESFAGGRTAIVFTYLPDDVLKNRMSARGLPRDRKKLENWEEFTRVSPSLPLSLSRYEHRLINTTKPTEESVIEAVSYILSQ